MNMLPKAFIERMMLILPQAPIETLFAPKTDVSFRINTLKTKGDEIIAWLEEVNLPYQRWEIYPQALILPASRLKEVQQSAFVERGELYQQGLQSMIPVLALKPLKGESIIDLCAAPGSKSSMICAEMSGEGELVLNEAVRERFYKLKTMMSLMGVNAECTMYDGRRWYRPDVYFDRVLVDAPCSSEGRFRLDDPKSVGYWSERKIHEASFKQKGLIKNACRLCKPGGVIVYSTCTFAPEENEEVIDWILKHDPSMSLQPIDLGPLPTYPALMKWKKKTYDSRISHCMRIYPDAKLEGFFIAKLVKSHYK